ncbi:hypothetical protein J2X76_006040 [Neorhizobium sp. 2083]|nr:hypothetical protein [Neorhizobium sp. 2083]
MNTTWERWFATMNLPYPGTRGPGYSHGSMSIDAAIRGAGVALGRSILVAEDLAADRLVSLFPGAAIEVEWGYDLLYRVGNQDDPKIRAFRNWMLKEVQEFMPRRPERPTTNYVPGAVTLTERTNVSTVICAGKARNGQSAVFGHDIARQRAELESSRDCLPDKAGIAPDLF